MGRFITGVSVVLLIYGIYNIVAAMVGLCILVPYIIFSAPGAIRDWRKHRALMKSVDDTLEKNRQWMRDNGRADEIAW